MSNQFLLVMLTEVFFVGIVAFLFTKSKNKLKDICSAYLFYLLTNYAYAFLPFFNIPSSYIAILPAILTFVVFPRLKCCPYTTIFYITFIFIRILLIYFNITYFGMFMWVSFGFIYIGVKYLYKDKEDK